MRFRKWNSDKQDYDDEQIWVVHNNIVFTDDGWQTAKMALGHIVNEAEGIDAWGLVADLIVGKMVAGENLIIEALASDGTTVAFRVDGNGAQLHNAKFDLIKNNGQITLYPETGLVGGQSTASSPLFSYDVNGNISGVMSEDGDTLTSVTQIDSNDLPNANFWIDMDGNAFFRGKIYGTDGEFSGTLKATTLDGVLTAGSNGGKITGVALNIGNGAFTVDRYGNANIGGAVITDAEMYAPSISGDEIIVDGLFEVDNNGYTCGYIGPATGAVNGDDGLSTTRGIAMADASTYRSGSINYETDGRYVIVTESGVRLQAGSNRITVRDDGIWITTDQGSAWYNGKEIGTGSGTAVFG